MSVSKCCFLVLNGVIHLVRYSKSYARGVCMLTGCFSWPDPCKISPFVSLGRCCLENEFGRSPGFPCRREV